MKRWLKMVTGIVLCAGSFFWADTGCMAQTVLKVGTATQPDHIYNQGIKHFESIVEAKTNGAIDIQLFPAAQLGSEREMVEGLQLGTLEMCLTSTGPLGNFIPDVKVFNLPFLFKDRATCYQMLDGPIGNDISQKFLAIGIRSLGWFENGFRNITNSVRPIRSPQDMQGLKIRVMEDDLFIISMQSLGAAPLPMAFGELFTALEQGAVHAQENPLAVIYSSRLFEVQKYLAITGHFYSPAMLLVSETVWQKLPPSQQKVLVNAAVVARDYERGLSREADQNLEIILKSEGMVISHPDKNRFTQAVRRVYTDPKVMKAVGGGDMASGKALIERVRQAVR